VEDRDEVERRRTAMLAVGWLLAAALAVTVGVVAVTTVGASMRGRGPLGNEVVREELQVRSSEVDETLPLVERTFSEEFGELDVACQGLYAIGLDARPDKPAGWQVVSYESGPDDDVDAVFANNDRSIEIEVYCNGGEPTVSDLERNTLPDRG
jgi:hypothetical protein